jgi:hypothetical protein
MEGCLGEGEINFCRDGGYPNPGCDTSQSPNTASHGPGATLTSYQALIIEGFRGSFPHPTSCFGVLEALALGTVDKLQGRRLRS